MSKRAVPELSVAEQRAILKLWAASIGVAEAIPRERLLLVDGMETILENIGRLPEAIGWGPASPPPVTPAPHFDPARVVVLELSSPGDRRP
jgi:hypothetical protein